MAVKFVRSLAGGAATGADWANAYLTLAVAAAAIAAGDTVWVADDHAETQATAMTINFPGTTASPNFVYCADHNVASPGTGDLKTTGSVTTTGNSGLTIGGSAYIYGLTFNCGTGAVNAILTLANSSSYQRYENCAFNKLGTTATSGAITIGQTSSLVEWINCPIKLGANNDSIKPLANFNWKYTPSAVQGNLPTIGLFNLGNCVGIVRLQGVDLSALTAGKTIFTTNNMAGGYFLEDCALGAGVTISGTPTTPGWSVYSTRSDSGATNYRSEQYSFQGTLVPETSIVATGGASDGTTPISWKITTTANARFLIPFEAPPIAAWNDKITGNLTVSVEGIWSGGAPGLPNNDDVWMEVGYLGSALTPIRSYVSGTKANNLATGTAQTASTAAWGASPATPTKFKMVSTFVAPAQKGTIYVTVKCGKASTVFYVDPKVTLS